MSENQEVISKAHAAALATVQRQLAPFAGSDIAAFLGAMYSTREFDDGRGSKTSRVGQVDITSDLERFERGPMARANALARAFRRALAV